MAYWKIYQTDDVLFLPLTLSRRQWWCAAGVSSSRTAKAPTSTSSSTSLSARTLDAMSSCSAAPQNAHVKSARIVCDSRAPAACNRMNLLPSWPAHSSWLQIYRALFLEKWSKLVLHKLIWPLIFYRYFTNLHVHWFFLFATACILWINDSVITCITCICEVWTCR